ncbi:ClpXP protease specificity-enhancing factor [Saccharophagus degradans]|uniref:Stringent starvation protein B n=1 Tax=Saccharophagus degradans (strain 2-40 / ATCC 43961 / DSM 17024) TaxID=203122 RepID=Q21FW3_SACD2|nr:ClpXP protease specificity-enhancing factor [Saccharophagus degradans]ABD82416.1 Stringent starvation protein B [Saccharophagus degradans 2-40]
MTMTSNRPYMIRALYEWILDNDFTPHLVVFAHAPNVEVPQEYVNKDGQIVLNIAPRAVEGLDLGNKAISFQARFGGVPTHLYVPCQAVLGIYARENGQGMMFDLESNPEPDPDPAPVEPDPKSAKRPSLRVVK